VGEPTGGQWRQFLLQPNETSLLQPNFLLGEYNVVSSHNASYRKPIYIYIYAWELVQNIHYIYMHGNWYKTFTIFIRTTLINDRLLLFRGKTLTQLTMRHLGLRRAQMRRE
jgi:hypothetical protein